MKEHFLKLLLPIRRTQTLQISENPKERLSVDRVGMFACILSLPQRARYSARTLYQVKLQVHAPVIYHAASFATVFPTVYQMYLKYRWKPLRCFSCLLFEGKLTNFATNNSHVPSISIVPTSLACIFTYIGSVWQSKEIRQSSKERDSKKCSTAYSTHAAKTLLFTIGQETGKTVEYEGFHIPNSSSC